MLALNVDPGRPRPGFSWSSNSNQQQKLTPMNADFRDSRGEERIQRETYVDPGALARVLMGTPLPGCPSQRHNAG